MGIDLQSAETNVSILLDTLMYSDALKEDVREGMNVREIVDILYGDESSSPVLDELNTHENRAAVIALKQYFDSTDDKYGLGDLVFHSASDNMGSGYEGVRGAVFSSDGEPKTVYVAFRGTGEGRWFDNGDALGKTMSPYQEQTVKYFDEMMEKLNVKSSDNVIVTGHSKGGNLAQTVTLVSINAELVDQCISIDGQGFSPEAIQYFKDTKGNEFYEAQRQKMYSVSGDDDYVNVLGIKVIPDENTTYVKTACTDWDFTNAHAPYKTPKPEEGVDINEFWYNQHNIEGNLYDYSTGTFNTTTTEQRSLAQTVMVLNESMMQLPLEERGKACRTIMSTFEMMLGGENNILKEGLNGETATKDDWQGLFHAITMMAANWVNSDDYKKIEQQIGNDILSLRTRQRPGCQNNFFVIVVAYSTVMLLKYGIVGTACFLECLANKIMEIHDTIVVEYVISLMFVNNLKNSVTEFAKKVFVWGYAAAQSYLENNSEVLINTENLRDLADRLELVNSKLYELDKRMYQLYHRVRFTDLWDLLHADTKVEYSLRLARCVDYMCDTADRFEAAEQEILRLLGC